MTDVSRTPSRYLQFLPSAYAGQSPNTGLYLKIFEKILSGIPADELAAAERIAQGSTAPADELLARKGVAEVLDVIAEFFFPRFSFLFPEDTETFLPEFQPEDFQELSYYVTTQNIAIWYDEWLAWLGGWSAFILPRQASVQEKREFVARIIPYFRIRGTYKGLLSILYAYFHLDDTGRPVSPTQPVQGIVLSDSDTFVPPPQPIVVGKFAVRENYDPGDAVVGGAMPYCFVVELKLAGGLDADAIRAIAETAREVIDRERPAHTNYFLKLPSLQAGSVKVGVNSLVTQTP